jgi:hypothetical protein
VEGGAAPGNPARAMYDDRAQDVGEDWAAAFRDAVAAAASGRGRAPLGGRAHFEWDDDAGAPPTVEEPMEGATPPPPNERIVLDVPYRIVGGGGGAEGRRGFGTAAGGAAGRGGRQHRQAPRPTQVAQPPRGAAPEAPPADASTLTEDAAGAYGIGETLADAVPLGEEEVLGGAPLPSASASVVDMGPAMGPNAAPHTAAERPDAAAGSR